MLFIIALGVTFLFALLTTFYLVPLMAGLARRWNILDSPDGKLKVHKQPTPYLGGVAVYIGFIIAFIAALITANLCTRDIILCCLGYTILVGVGLIDDIIVIKPHEKLLGQFLATICFVKAGCYLNENIIYLGGYNTFFSCLWVLSVINAYNLIDIMDGLATTVASMTAFAFLLCALVLGDVHSAYILVAFLGALIAFGWYNKPLASIYLGDAGSLLLGGVLASMPYKISWDRYVSYGYITPIILLLIPLLELGTLILIRLYKRIPIYRGSPDHFALYLRRSGWSVYAILGYVAAISCALLLLGLTFISNYISCVTLILCVTCVITLWYSTLIVSISK